MGPSRLLLVMKEREGGRENEGEERGTRKTGQGRKGTEDIDRLGERRKGEEEAVGTGSPGPVREKVISSFQGLQTGLWSRIPQCGLSRVVSCVMGSRGKRKEEEEKEEEAEEAEEEEEGGEVEEEEEEKEEDNHSHFQQRILPKGRRDLRGPMGTGENPKTNDLGGL